jgi:hypothetical protein
MEQQEKGLFFPLEEQDYKAVCKVANSQDKTLGQALSLLINKGLEALEIEAVGRASLPLDADYLHKQLTEAYSLTVATHEEVGELLLHVESRLGRSCLEEIVEQEEE